MKKPFFLKGNMIDGKNLAESQLEVLGIKIATLSKKPCLAVIMVGNHPPSEVYVRHKVTACAKIGIGSKKIHLDENTSEDDLIAAIKMLNEDQGVHGILLQLPLPKHLDKNNAIQAIDPLKDVDGLTIENQGLLFAGRPRFIPCTPLGCMSILEMLTDLRGKNITVVGRSYLVGRPLAALLTHKDATVTLAHGRTESLFEHTKRADIVISAVGQPGLIRAEAVKEGAIVLDVGITRVGDILKGDVDFENVSPKCAAITPVPGGIGPLTIASLMKNTVLAYELTFKK